MFSLYRNKSKNINHKLYQFMKLKNLFIIALLMIAGLSSCKKETTINPATPVVPVTPYERLLLSVTGMNRDYTFAYNADKTIKSYTWGGGFYKGEFSYQPNKLVLNFFDNNGAKAGDNIYELSNGITQKLTSTNYAANGTILDIYVTLCSYNAGGQLIKETYTKNGVPNGETDWSYDNNGDLSGLIAKDMNGTITWQTTYEYDLSLFDKAASYGQFNSNVTGFVYPKKAIHLIKKQTVIENNITKIYNYNYTFDAQGYVLTGIVKDNNNVLADNWTNTWQ
jgi:hypothetical protein